MVPNDIAQPSLADEGLRRIIWAEGSMPVLAIIREPVSYTHLTLPTN